MKTVAMTGLVLSVAGFTQVAQAQSSVTLYGLIDAGFGYTKTNAGNRYAMMNGNLNGDRWGLRGREDLGAGWAAIFQLEDGYNVGTGAFGQGGREFGRTAIVGVTNDRYGTLKIGRQYDSMTDQVQVQTGEAYLGSQLATAGDVDNNDNSARVNNVIKYISPVMAGLQVEGMVALGGIAGSSGQANTYAAGASYVVGKATLSAGYLKAYNTDAATAGARRASWTGTTDSVFDGVVNSGYQTAHSIGIAQLTGKYGIGPFTLALGYSNAQYANDAQSTFAAREKYNTGKAFVWYEASPFFHIGAGYSFTKASGDTSASYHQGGVGTVYNLSKRTDLYAVCAYQHASGTQRTINGGTQTAQASIGSYGISGTSSQEMLIVGMRHRF